VTAPDTLASWLKAVEGFFSIITWKGVEHDVGGRAVENHFGDPIAAGFTVGSGAAR
jgi:hypothetical protein